MLSSYLSAFETAEPNLSSRSAQAVDSSRPPATAEALPDFHYRPLPLALYERYCRPPLRQVGALPWPAPSPSAAAASKCCVHPLPSRDTVLRPTSAPPSSVGPVRTVRSASPPSAEPKDPYAPYAELRHIEAQSRKDVRGVSKLQQSPQTVTERCNHQIAAA